MGRKWEEEGERRTGKQGITVVAHLSQIDLRLGKSAATVPCSSLDKIMLGIPKGEEGSWKYQVRGGAIYFIPIRGETTFATVE